MSEDGVSAYAQGKRFSRATVERWLTRPACDQDALLDLAVRLRLGENHFRDILDLLEDIAARRGTALSEVLALPIASALSRGMGRNDAIKALKNVLRRLRYPKLSEIEERLGALGRSLCLPPGAAISFPQNLEGEHVSVTLRAESPAELRAQAAALVSAVDRVEIDEIFRLLEGEW